MIYSNRLAENVSMTVSGLQVPGPLIGGAARMMTANNDWAPVLPIRQSAATLWYHANTPNHMASRSITVSRECGWWKMNQQKSAHS
jgi:suppressor of ftsI